MMVGILKRLHSNSGKDGAFSRQADEVYLRSIPRSGVLERTLHQREVQRADQYRRFEQTALPVSHSARPR
jgi:hypothetical protein